MLIRILVSSPHSRPTGPAERQYKGQFPTCCTQRMQGLQIKRSYQSIFICDFKNARKDRTDSTLACVVFLGIFHVRALRTTSWQPVLNFGIIINIGRFDHANIGTLDICIKPKYTPKIANWQPLTNYISITCNKTNP